MLRDSRPQTAVEKMLAAASNRTSVQPGDIVSPAPELVIIHDGYIESAYEELRSIGYRKIVHPERVMFITDHDVAYGTLAAAARGLKNRRVAREWGISMFYDVGRGGQGHIFPIEQGLVRPGMVLFAYDMHCTNFGAVGALAIAAGTEVVTVLATGTLWYQVPHTVKLNLNGAVHGGIMGRDVGFYITALFRNGKLGAKHDNRIIEFSGPYVDRLPLSQRVALCSSLTEIGVSNVYFAPAPELAGATSNAMSSDANAEYEAVIDLDLSRLPPQVALPGGPDRGVDIATVAGKSIDHAMIGSCGSGMYDDFAMAAEFLRGREVAAHVRLYIVPGTVETMQQMSDNGLTQVFQKAGALVLPPGCGPCAGGAIGPMADGEVSISTAATNHVGRFGSKKADAYLGSPLTVVASAIAGRIADPRSFFDS